MTQEALPRLRQPAQRTWLWVTGVVFCCLAILLAYEYFLRSEAGQYVEVAALTSRYYEITQGPLQDGTLRQILWYLPYTVAVIAATIFVAIMFARQRLLAAAIAVSAASGGFITTQLMKTFWLDRPAFEVPLADEQMATWWGNNGFPSGHAALATAAVVAVFLLSAPKQRPVIGLLAAFLASATGGAIFLVGGHSPSEILAAYLVVAAWGIAGGWVIMRVESRWNTVTIENDTEVGASAGLAWFLGIVITGAALLSYVIGGGWSSIMQAAENHSGWHWVAGVLSSVGPGFLIAAAGINLFDAEAGRRRHGMPLDSGARQRAEAPPQFAHLYEV